MTQNDDFAKAIAFAWTPFLLILKLPDFSSIGCFSQRVFAYNNYIVPVETFLICLREFYFLTQSDDFKKGYSLCMEAIFADIQIVSFFEYYVFFKAVFCLE